MATRDRVTIKDVAREAGVSLSSVHLALSGKAGVSEKTRQRILGIAKRMEYTPSPLAASLKRETLTIAVVLPEKNSSSRFYYDFMWINFFLFIFFSQPHLQCLLLTFQ